MIIKVCEKYFKEKYRVPGGSLVEEVINKIIFNIWASFFHRNGMDNDSFSKLANKFNDSNMFSHIYKAWSLLSYLLERNYDIYKKQL